MTTELIVGCPSSGGPAPGASHPAARREQCRSSWPQASSVSMCVTDWRPAGPMTACNKDSLPFSSSFRWASLSRRSPEPQHDATFPSWQGSFEEPASGLNGIRAVGHAQRGRPEHVAANPWQWQAARATAADGGPRAGRATRGARCLARRSLPPPLCKPPAVARQHPAKLQTLQPHEDARLAVRVRRLAAAAPRGPQCPELHSARGDVAGSGRGPVLRCAAPLPTAAVGSAR